MNIAGIYSFKNGQAVIEKDFSAILEDIEGVIHSVDAAKCHNKASKEKTMDGKLLYSPRALNKAFASEFEARQWQRNVRVSCEYMTASHQ
jgi:hypothetical protein